ncbi:winged helix-turn-helix domain-containing protein [Corynebacterium sp. CCM 9185]|uniref:Winged helix-turn-helix transcriptional regulator n=1 Tax=Corynebacterium marambiense TaxID=2765364 RepID=A0ABS0VRR8_9CORY|nr:winged helix-turn-helix domain-containing protein [Corynebacterium marambiense]MBI8999473.1 winged helix-turn-helix transcriptional regulator [Corynebacterium marambiense]MCK7662311.1 winged helix-turn-helix domain-containing protein [Corynebacterium marambiense]
MTEAQELADLRKRVTDLESRVRILENPGTPEPPLTDGDGAITGTVRYSGELTAPRQLRWTITLDAETARSVPSDGIAEVLAAVSSPVRLIILRELLVEPASARQLQELLGYSSPGPLYHHLKPLQSAGIVARDGDGKYQIPGPRVVPLLILLAAAGDVAGEFRDGTVPDQ